MATKAQAQANNKRRAEAAVKNLQQKYGEKGGSIGPRKKADGYVISTGIESLNYALGLPGIPSGTIIEIAGPPDIGKSSSLGLSIVGEAQKMDLLVGYIALEPAHTEREDDDSAREWLIANGVDPDGVVIAWPDNGDQAFDILFDWVKNKVVDLVVFDSIGAVTNAGELDESKKPKPNVGGEARLITWGLNRIPMLAEKNNVTVVLINQIRDRISDPNGEGAKTPGGWAKEHICPIRLRLRPGSEKFTEKGAEGEFVMHGRDIIVRVIRNKLAHGTNQRAEFTYFQKPHVDKDGVEHPVGIDKVKDLRRTAKAVGVLKKETAKSSWYVHPAFPPSGPKKIHKVNGEKGVDAFLLKNPKAAEQLRREVAEKINADEKKRREEVRARRSKT